ncbi:unnamed protein product [Caenorhabditis nigoni]
MTIRLLSLPIDDLQYTLNCMDIGDLIAFSLCSKRTKNLVKASNRKMRPIEVYVKENYIRFEVREGNDYESISFHIFDFYIELIRKEFKVWRKREFTQIDWIAHFISIVNGSMIDYLNIDTVSLSYLDAVYRFFPKCRRLDINERSSREFTKIAFWKLYPIAEKLDINKNIFDDDENDISKVLTLNLKDLSFQDWRNPFKLELDDLLVLNIARLTIAPTNITEKDLNRFLKLWMKGNHKFYRPRNIRLSLRNLVNREEVLRGIKYQIVSNRPQLKRADGKELLVSIRGRCVTFNFQG